MNTAVTRLHHLARGFVTAMFPPVCAACARIGTEPFCSTCAAGLDPVPPFQVDGASASVALHAYGGPMADAIRALKYRGRIELGATLGRALAALLPAAGPVDVVVPVPLSPSRLRSRGFNQAVELARALPLPIRHRALVRREEALDQVGLGKEARVANLAGAFLPGPQRVDGLRVLLVDDVITTGATARAAVLALRARGARRVAVLAAARTAQPEP